MPEDIKLSKNYPALFNEALTLRNIDRMNDIFKELINELGVPDPVGLEAQRAAGKAIAEMMNLKNQNPGAIKI